MILGIDPGNEKSAYVLWDGQRVRDRNILKNESILDLAGVAKSEECAIGIEMISSYGMPVGREVFETCVWIVLDLGQRSKDAKEPNARFLLIALERTQNGPG